MPPGRPPTRRHRQSEIRLGVSDGREGPLERASPEVPPSAKPSFRSSQIGSIASGSSLPLPYLISIMITGQAATESSPGPLWPALARRSPGWENADFRRRGRDGRNAAVCDDSAHVTLRWRPRSPAPDRQEDRRTRLLPIRVRGYSSLPRAEFPPPSCRRVPEPRMRLQPAVRRHVGAL